jgi:hypothetical protein
MNQVCQGAATIVERAPGHYVLSIDAAGSTYCNAQLDDYHHLARASYPWQAPLRLSLDARLTGDAKGTWGFGFWNAPYSPLANRWPALPATAWFFGNGSGDVGWGVDSTPTGFKAATLETRRWQVLLMVLIAPILYAFLHVPILYPRLWPYLSKLLRLHEQMLPIDAEWHAYVLEWQRDEVIWFVDGVEVCRTPFAPTGRLGLCIWVDNQWLVAGPRRGFGWGLVPSQTTLEIRELKMINYEL